LAIELPLNHQKIPKVVFFSQYTVCLIHGLAWSLSSKLIFG
jgi:hypothetical protein